MQKLWIDKTKCYKFHKNHMYNTDNYSHLIDTMDNVFLVLSNWILCKKIYFLSVDNVKQEMFSA